MEALCNAYPYILDHSQIEMEDTSNTAELRRNAGQLYHDLTTYDYFLFFFIYRDVTLSFTRISKQLQARDIQISGVGRYISVLHKCLKSFYSEDQEFRGELHGDGHAEALMHELFDGEFNILMVYLLSNLY